MTQYAYYDSTQPLPSPVLGWYDTAMIAYSNLPASSDLFAVASEQWDNRLSGQWAIAAGPTLAAYTPPAPTLTAQQQLAQEGAALIAGGLTITSTGTPALDGVYAAGAPAQANMIALVSYINHAGTFPNGASTLTWYDIADQPHVFPSVTEFMALYTAGLDFVMAVQLVVDAGVGTLPPATATIP